MKPLSELASELASELSCEVITSVRNPLIKDLRSLARSSQERQKSNSLIFEGTHLLQEAIAHQYPLQILGFTEQWHKQHPELCLQASKFVERIILLTESVLATIATSVNPDGVIATANIHLQPPQMTNLGLALWYIQDPGNMGTIIRSAVAAGCDGIILSDNSVDITNPKILRASAGQWFRCPMQTSPDFTKTIKSCQHKGMQIVATTATAQLSYWEWNFLKPTLILLGNEGHGLPTQLEQLADGIVKIPLINQVESLNVAIAGSLVLYEALRQRQSSRK